MNINITSDIKFVNVGEDPPRPKRGWVGRRQWNACVEYNFLSAGQHIKYSRPLMNLNRKDIIAAYISGSGYVGIGIVEEQAVKIREFKFNGKSLEELSLDPRFLSGNLNNSETFESLPYLRKTLFQNADNDNTEYAVRIQWYKTVDRKDAFWKPRSGLFANPSIQSSLKNQPATLAFLEESFGLKLTRLDQQV